MNTTLVKRQLLIAAALSVFSQFAVGNEEEDAQRVCTVIDSMGAAIECAVNASEDSVDISADTTDAEQMCTAFSEMVVALTGTLSNDWKMRIFTPQSNDTPAAVCELI
jgi:hypothetical protein